MLKVLFVAHEEELNGASKSLLNIIQEIQDNIKVFVLVRKQGRLTEELNKLRCEVIIMPFYLGAEVRENDTFKSRIKWEVKELRYIFYRLPITLRTAFLMSKFVKKNRIDIVHSNSSSVFVGAFISKLSKCYHVWHFREFLKEDFNMEPLLGWKQFYKLVNSTTNRVICVSKSVEEKYKDKITVAIGTIYNGVPDTSKLYKVKHKNFNIIQVGIVSPVKGADTAIDALKILWKKGYKDIHLYFAGKGNLTFYNKDLNLIRNNIHLLGYVNDIDDLRSRISDIELVCSRSEAFGRVTVEAMLAQNVVVGADTAGTKEIIKNGVNGFTFKMGDAKQLSDIIIKLYSSPQIRREIGEEARKEALNKYGIKRCVKEILDVYKYLMEEKVIL